MGILDTLLMIAAVVLIILSLLQSGKSDGLGSAFGGSEGLNLFANVKERGSEKVMSNVTLVTGVVFFALVIIIRIVSKKDRLRSFFNGIINIWKKEG